MVPHSVYEECTLLTLNEVYTLYLHIFISSLFMSNRLNTEPSSEQQLLNLVVCTVFFSTTFIYCLPSGASIAQCAVNKEFINNIF